MRKPGSRLRRGVGALLALCAVSCLGCRQDDTLLLVTLRTDLVPGVEFLSTRIVVHDPNGRSLPREQVRAVGSEADFVRGVQVGELGGLPRGDVRFDLELLGPHEETVVQRPVIVTLDARQQNATIVVSRDCAGVTCPLAEDDPAATACLGGQCVRPECTDQDRDGCGASQCTEDGVCPEGAPCGTPRCDPMGVCLLVGDRSRCRPGEYCQPELGCEALPGTGDDAGMDAGIDAGTDAGSDAGAPDTGPDAALEDRACPTGHWWVGGECLFDDPRLISLLPSVGYLSPIFSPDQHRYEVRGIMLEDDMVSVTPAVTDPSGATIYVDGTPVPSGMPSAPRTLLLGETDLTVEVQAATGRIRRYQLLVRRPSSQRFVPPPDAAFSGLGGRPTMTDTRLLVTEEWGGQIHSYVRTEAGWAYEQTLHPTAEMASGGGPNLWGGWHVPALSADGTFLAVGDEYALSQAGSINLIRLSAGSWAHEGDLLASNGEPGDQFGYDLDVSGDGQWLVAGARGEDGDGLSPTSNAVSNSGAAYVYRWDGTNFVEDAYLKASNAAAGDSFGVSVAVSDDGAVAVVGATLEDSDLTSPANDNLPDSGAGYVFRRVDGAWQEEAILKGSAAAAGDWSGWDVAISGDGTTVMTTGYSGTAGPVHVFRHDGSSWDEEAQLAGSNTEAFDWYGRSSALSTDGNSIIVGAPWEQGSGLDPADNSVDQAGAVYLFRRVGGVWDGGTYLKSPSVTAGAQFGLHVGISPDGSRYVVGSAYGLEDVGVVYVFP